MHPHKHHDGSITLTFCEGLMRDFIQMEADIPVDPPAPGDDWEICRQNWLDNLEYARLRLQEVMDAITQNKPLTEDYHGKVVDICLSMKDDFAYGKAHDFVAQKEGQ